MNPGDTVMVVWPNSCWDGWKGDVVGMSGVMIRVSFKRRCGNLGDIFHKHHLKLIGGRVPDAIPKPAEDDWA
jgi:hypothetical protein